MLRALVCGRHAPVLGLALFLLAALTFAQEPAGKSPDQAVADQKPAAISIFEYPPRAEAARQLTVQGVLRFRAGDGAAAEQLCRQAVEAAPFFADAHYNLGCILNLRGKTAEAFAALDAALGAGFANAQHLAQDDDWKSQRENPEFIRRLDALRMQPQAKPPEPQPAAVKDGVALVSRDNTMWNPSTGLLQIAFAPAEAAADPPPVMEGQGEVAKKLREWLAEGTAAGHRGDYYDNCDRDHSNLNRKTFPQLTFIEYAPEVAKETGYGLQITRLYNGVVIGNSSTAQTAGPGWRSNPRLAYFRDGGMGALVRQYLANHVYFYPEHRDHDPGHNGPGEGYGDVYPANTPYVVISQGSSGSDQPFLSAFAATLAAFRPEVKAKLAQENLLAPALQGIFRQANKTAPTRAAYFSGAAHPTVFDAKNLDPLRMIELAHNLTLETLPPLALIRVAAEERFQPGRDYFDAGERERLFDTPFACARLWRATTGKRKYLLSADESRSLSRQPLRFRWVLLRGDPAACEIKPLDETGSRAEITLEWRPRRPIAEGSAVESNRVDIGLFAVDGELVSPPAFFCVSTLDNEARQYDERGRLQTITYTGAGEPGNYVDPAYDLPKSWRDEYRYDDQGRLLGWTRNRGDAREEFSPAGLLVEERDDAGRCAVGRVVKYAPAPRAGKPPILQQEATEVRLKVSYSGPNDLVGKAEPLQP